MVDAATGEGAASDMDMSGNTEADLSGEGDVSLLPNLNIDQSQVSPSYTTSI